jgi:hypothetical protein
MTLHVGSSSEMKGQGLSKHAQRTEGRIHLLFPGLMLDGKKSQGREFVTDRIRRPHLKPLARPIVKPGEPQLGLTNQA